MSPLVLIGLVLVVVGIMLLAFMLRARQQQVAAVADRPRTVADLIRLRDESDSILGPAGSPCGRSGGLALVPAGAEGAALPDLEPARPVRHTGNGSSAGTEVLGAAAIPPRTEPAFGPADDDREDVPSWLDMAPEEPLEPLADGVSDTPWRRAAMMSAGLAGGQEWPVPEPRSAPAEQDPEGSLADRSVGAEGSLADRSVGAGGSLADPSDEDTGPIPLPIVAPLSATAPVPDSAPEKVADSLADGDYDEEAEALAQAEAMLLAQRNGASAQATPAARDEPVETDGSLAGASAEAAEPGSAEQLAIASPDDGGADIGSAQVKVPTEEQEAADLALARTFGFVDPAQRPEAAPVVAMTGEDARSRPGALADADGGSAGEQPVRFLAVSRGGAPVPGASITLLDGRGGEVAESVAGADGTGAVSAPDDGSYVLVSTAPGHLPGAVAVTVAGAPVDAEVLLVRSASLSGVVRGEDGPVAGARLTLVQDGDPVESVDTDASGGYRIADIPAGEYALSVAAAGCEPAAVLISVVAESDVRHDVLLAPGTPVAELL